MQESEAALIDDFFRNTEDFRGAWQSLDVRVAWAEVATTKVCLYLRADLTSNLDAAISPEQSDPTSPPFIYRRLHLAPQELGGLLAGIRDGRLQLAGETIDLSQWDGKSFRPLNLNLHLTRYPKQHQADDDLSPPRLELIAYMPRLQELAGDAFSMGNLEDVLRRLPGPYASLRDLRVNLFGQETDEHADPVGLLRIVAHLPVRFLPSTGPADNTLTVRVEAADGVDLPFINVGVIRDRAPALPERYSISFPADHWKPSGARSVAVCTSEDPDSSRVTLFLRFRSRVLAIVTFHVLRTSSENPLFRAHVLLDPAVERLTLALTGVDDERKSDALGFEWAVACVLHYLRLNPMQHGVLRALENEIDLISILESKRTIVLVECTTASRRLEEKMAVVQLRFATFRDAFPELTIIPALATSLRDVDIPVHIKEAAGKNWIPLITRENLLALLELARQNTSQVDALGVFWSIAAARMDTPTDLLIGKQCPWYPRE